MTLNVEYIMMGRFFHYTEDEKVDPDKCDHPLDQKRDSAVGPRCMKCGGVSPLPLDSYKGK